MAYKIVNDDSLTSVANAIRVKGSISGTLEFPDGFVSAIQNLSPSSNDFIITASKDGQGNLTIDKTFSEVATAYNAGKNIAVKGDEDNYHAGMFYFDDNCFYIYGIQFGGDDLNPTMTDDAYVFYSNLSYLDDTKMYYEPHDTTATPSDVASGKTFINRSGHQTGTATPPSGTYSITSNGIYDIVSFASVDVNVSGGGGGDHDVEDGIINRTISGVYENSRVTSIGNYAFASCKNLTTVSFPSVTSIGTYAFAYCTSLTIASFPNVTSIGTYAFAYCSKLTTASFPNVTSIGNYTFASCSSLTTVSFPSTTSIGQYAFQYCSGLTTASFPNATSIGYQAFYNCVSLTTVSFLVGKSFGNQCFRSCTHLESLYILASSVATLGTSAFILTPMSLSSYLGYFGSIYVPASLVDTYKSATNWSEYANRITSYVE